jgi:hypothetical protein
MGADAELTADIGRAEVGEGIRDLAGGEEGRPSESGGRGSHLGGFRKRVLVVRVRNSPTVWRVGRIET